MDSRSQWVVAKEDASEAKKTYDGLVSQLNILIHRGPDLQATLPFNNATDPTNGGEDESWRDATVIDALSLSPGQYSKLEEAGVTTIGQLEDLRAGDGLASIKGFGQATVDAIEDAVINWLATLPTGDDNATDEDEEQ